MPEMRAVDLACRFAETARPLITGPENIGGVERFDTAGDCQALRGIL